MFVYLIQIDGAHDFSLHTRELGTARIAWIARKSQIAKIDFPKFIFAILGFRSQKLHYKSGKSKWGLSNGGLRPLSAICAQSSTIVHFCGPFGPLSKGNFRHNEDNRRQSWTMVDKYLKPPFAKPAFGHSRASDPSNSFFFVSIPESARYSFWIPGRQSFCTKRNKKQL